MSEDKTPPEDLEPSRARRISELFQQACELGAEQREAFLDEACAGDARLRAEVESLLAHDATGIFGTESRTEQVRGLFSELVTDPHPTRIGPYKIFDVLGEGGMGIVYVAELEKPVRRKVAAADPRGP